MDLSQSTVLSLPELVKDKICEELTFTDIIRFEELIFDEFFIKKLLLPPRSIFQTCSRKSFSTIDDSRIFSRWKKSRMRS